MACVCENLRQFGDYSLVTQRLKTYPQEMDELSKFLIDEAYVLIDNRTVLDAVRWGICRSSFSRFFSLRSSSSNCYSSRKSDWSKRTSWIYFIFISTRMSRRANRRWSMRWSGRPFVDTSKYFSTRRGSTGISWSSFVIRRSKKSVRLDFSVEKKDLSHRFSFCKVDCSKRTTVRRNVRYIGVWANSTSTIHPWNNSPSVAFLTISNRLKCTKKWSIFCAENCRVPSMWSNVVPISK